MRVAAPAGAAYDGPVPELAGKYDVRGTLGSGASGTVYLGVQVDLDRPVAIKELSPALAGDPTFLERFREEARVMAQLDNPNCVKVYELIETEGRAFLVSEYVDGATLRKVVEQAGRLTPEQSLGVLKGALYGLGYAHALGLVHRDVKPDNLIADREGVSKLADFGQAVFLAGPGAAGGMAAGTPAYMSPEQVMGANVDYRTDIYSCGAMLHELLTGRPPFTADSPMAMMRMHVTDPAPDPRAYRPDLCEEMAAMVTRSLSKDPTRRQQSCAEFITELQQAAEACYGAAWEERSSIKPLVAATMAALGVLGAGGGAAMAGAAEIGQGMVGSANLGLGAASAGAGAAHGGAVGGAFGGPAAGAAVQGLRPAGPSGGAIPGGPPFPPGGPPPGVPAGSPGAPTGPPAVPAGAGAGRGGGRNVYIFAAVGLLLLLGGGGGLAYFTGVLGTKSAKPIVAGGPVTSSPSPSPSTEQTPQPSPEASPGETPGASPSPGSSPTANPSVSTNPSISTNPRPTPTVARPTPTISGPPPPTPGAITVNVASMDVWFCVYDMSALTCGPHQDGATYGDPANPYVVDPAAATCNANKSNIQVFEQYSYSDPGPGGGPTPLTVHWTVVDPSSFGTTYKPAPAVDQSAKAGDSNTQHLEKTSAAAGPDPQSGVGEYQASFYISWNDPGTGAAMRSGASPSFYYKC
jgi:cell division septation protein DedD